MYDMITLPNGLRILTQPIPGVRTAALGIFIGTGSRHETATYNGAAHFLEHMAFKSTRTRTTAQIARQIDELGGQMNAYTTKESTCFYQRCLDSHLERAAELMCDMLLDGAFLDEEVDTERNVILEEIGMYRDTPEELVAERLAAQVYRGSSLARPILGTRSTLAGIGAEELRQYQRTHYQPDRIVVSLAGNFSKSTVHLLNDRFSALERTAPQKTPPARYHSKLVTYRKATEQNHLILAFPARSYMDEQRYTQQLLTSILGGGVSSRLFQQVREERGLCYSVYSYISDYKDTALLGMYAALSAQTEAQALDEMYRVAAELAEHGVTEEELNRAREQAKANVLMGLESVQARMSHAGMSLLLRDRISDREEILAGYDAVTVRELNQLAQELLDVHRCSLSAVGRVRPKQELQEQMFRFQSKIGD